MSFYRSFIAAVAAMGLATAAFAVDQTTAPTQPSDTQQTMQATDTAKTDANTPGEKVNVNTASAKELMAVKGLSSAKAKAIVTYRKKHGDFKSLDELKDVKGFKKMSDKAMKKLQDQLTVG